MRHDEEMGWPTSEELEALVRQFEAATVDQAAWTHQAHLAVGTWYVHHLGPAEALNVLRSGIRRLNGTHGTPNTDTRGYHETITRAYVHLLAVFLKDAGEGDVTGYVRALLSSPLAKSDLLLGFYSRERLMSAVARREWIEPDVRALPAGGLESTAVPG